MKIQNSWRFFLRNILGAFRSIVVQVSENSQQVQEQLNDIHVEV